MHRFGATLHKDNIAFLIEFPKLQKGFFCAQLFGIHSALALNLIGYKVCFSGKHFRAEGITETP
jgi:hypothetical protein